jgi:hypothetical protein
MKRSGAALKKTKLEAGNYQNPDCQFQDDKFETFRLNPLPPLE